MEKDKVFFSYSRADSEFVLKLAQDLEKSGINIWIDQREIQPGAHWDESIEKALDASSKLIVVLSETSVESDNVMDEVSFALESHKQVIPVLMQACKAPFRLKRLQHIDFINNYDSGLNQLLDVLRDSQSVQHKPGDEKAISAIKMRSKKPISKKYFLWGAGVIALAVIIFAVIKLIPGSSSEKNAWQLALQKNDSVGYTTYLQNYKSGKYSAQAQAKLDSLKMQRKTNIAEQTKKSQDSLVVGKFFRGGIICYIDENGLGGLVIAKEDQGKTSWNNAIQLCNDYRSGGFKDWHLPTNNELNRICKASTKIGNFKTDSYWSSSEAASDNTKAWWQKFPSNDCYQATIRKKVSFRVRAIRKFSL